ncbi:type II toxin-antitoxin system RelB/DinJ family antitoxin [Lactobacillus salsicarnum]|uniref:Type II toxin-antitoxin system RelB/DinJ family antitoxin n=2 Tax=Companilactobacillus mishanensis TaxID=2486008 RepID=A0ABW9P6B4_9LACO|nr:type II toxin-antitoxin system RelB/DinJ family antitoxin [Companilactobacillus mishanensis]
MLIGSNMIYTCREVIKMISKSDKVQVSFRIDKDDKEKVMEIYNNLGMSLSTAFNVFVKRSILEGGFPFETRDPFYSKKNMNELAKRIAQAKNNPGEVHQLLDD